MRRKRKQSYSLELLRGQRQSSKRGVGCLMGHPNCFQPQDFDSLRVSNRTKLVHNQLRAHMDRWMSRAYQANDPKKYHGWDHSEYGGKYVMCFVFKYRNSQHSVRLYGFLCNPDPNNPRFQLFVPVKYVSKRNQKTDTSILDRVASLARSQEVMAAIDAYSLEGENHHAR